MTLDGSLAAGALVLAIALGTTTESDAQAIYRCGNDYSALACANAKALDPAGPSGALQAIEARRLIAGQMRDANEMERNRLRNEALIKPALAGSLGPTRPFATAVSAPAQKKPARKKSNRFQSNDERDFIAAVPGSGRKKKPSS